MSKGRKASTYATPMMPVADTYMEVLYGDRVNAQIAYINDGRWLGLATYLPHRQLLTP